jgi:hypothetical protein
MTTVLAVLQEHSVAANEAQVARELRVLLDPIASTSSITADEAQFLGEFGGVPKASAEELRGLAARSAARAVLEAAQSLSRSQVAQLLGIDGSRVSHRTRERSLYSYAGAAGRRRYPAWQFRDGKLLPGLAEVLIAISEQAHPVTVRTFMATRDDALLLHGEPVSPIEWLAAGGRPAPVAELAATLGEQV